MWNRVHAYNLADEIAGEVQGLLMRVGMVEMTRSVLAKALEPLPIPSALSTHCISRRCSLYARQGETMELASYDNRLLAAAQAIGIAAAVL